MQRRNFLFNAAAGLGGIIVLPGLLKGQTSVHQQVPEPYPIDLVKEFVIAGHKDLDKTQAMLKEHPNLIHSKYDWGNGDFEEAIEGAGHLGNKPIANFLIDSGARVTLFVLTMLGKTELVKPVLDQYPQLVFANGPHGFTMLHHAKMGGTDAETLYTYLESKGLDTTWVKIK